MPLNEEQIQKKAAELVNAIAYKGCDPKAFADPGKVYLFYQLWPVEMEAIASALRSVHNEAVEAQAEAFGEQLNELHLQYRERDKSVRQPYIDVFNDIFIKLAKTKDCKLPIPQEDKSNGN